VPIFVPADAGDPLRQGDLLKDVTLCISGLDGKALTSTSRALVLSRRCSIEHAEQISVIRVSEFKESFYDELNKEAQSLDEVRRMYQSLRDGEAHPDRFYLGPYPEPPSLWAELDALFTISIPAVGDDRLAWLKAHRVARLDDAFTRDLHVRMFRGIATAGHDDFAWYPDGDLEVVVRLGEKFLTATKMEEGKANSALATAKASAADAGKLKGMEGEAKKWAEKRARIESELARYTAVRGARAGKKDAPPSSQPGEK
jgi:hypothetical protein